MKRSLLQFDDDKISFSKNKSQNTLSLHLQDYKVGDYVYYDDKLGYNNTTGIIKGLCICDEPEEEIFIELNRLLSSPWARNENSKMVNCEIPNYINGWDNTQYILSNFSLSELEGTIWGKLSNDEYIPSIEELNKICNILYRRTPKSILKYGLKNLLSYHMVYSSSCYDVDKMYAMLCFQTYQETEANRLDRGMVSIVLLHVK